MMDAHPYEEVAYDLYPLVNQGFEEVLAGWAPARTNGPWKSLPSLSEATGACKPSE